MNVTDILFLYNRRDHVNLSSRSDSLEQSAGFFVVPRDLHG